VVRIEDLPSGSGSELLDGSSSSSTSTLPPSKSSDCIGPGPIQYFIALKIQHVNLVALPDWLGAGTWCICPPNLKTMSDDLWLPQI